MCLISLILLISIRLFQDFDLAAIYVSDAQYNRNIYFDTSPHAVRLDFNMVKIVLL